MSQKKAFYNEHIPQNEYRRISSKERLKDRQLFDTTLPKLTASAAEKKALIEKITEEHYHLTAALLPQSIQASLQTDLYLKPIFKALGLV
jgi:hypothetical protein